MLNSRTPRRSKIQVLLRAAALIDVLAAANRPMSLAEIRRQVNLSKSTVFNILATLVDTGYVSIVPETRQYKLGPSLLRLGAAFKASHDVRAFAYPHMLPLRDLTGETVSLHIRIGWQRTCIDQVPSLHSLRRVIHIGRLRDLYIGAVGYVLLADMDPAEVKGYLARTNMIPVTPKTVTDPKRILARVLKADQLGYALLINESDDSIGAVAVPIRGSDGRVEAGLAVSGPENRWNEHSMQRALPEIRACAQRISSEMGWVAAESPTLLPRRSLGKKAQRGKASTQNGRLVRA